MAFGVMFAPRHLAQPCRLPENQSGCAAFFGKKTTMTQPTAPLRPADASTEIATLGGGCFWCVEAIFQDLKGVLNVESGYSGGRTLNPTYRDICTGATGHAEVIQVTFDPALISYAELLRIFFGVHDPTTLNRQGNDHGTQYRSVIFYHSPTQKTVAEEVRTEAQDVWDDPVVTEIAAFDHFYKAEAYHQNYFKDNPHQPYCSIVIAPKVRKFREMARTLLV
jgi:peptide-methionine (S)-S-oxide reductase